MSSGSEVPYHLRPNKFIERQLFVELLEHIGHAQPLSESVYVSMGGRFLEDFKLVHSTLGISDLVSLESDHITYDRQIFNRPLALIDCLNQDSSDFVTNFDQFAEKYSDKNFIVWLDYADAQKRQRQLREYQELVSKLTPNDIVKITLNASVKTLGDRNDFSTQDEYQEAALEKLKNKLGDYFPDQMIGHEKMNHAGIASVLAQSVKKSALQGIAGRQDYVIQPLTSFRYNDGMHQMLTVTIAILDKNNLRSFMNDIKINNWQFLIDEWGDVIPIEIPDLSLKEQRQIDESLFIETDEIVHSKLPFKFHKDNNKSLAILKAYTEHYQRFPNFLRVTV